MKKSDANTNFIIKCCIVIFIVTAIYAIATRPVKAGEFQPEVVATLYADAGESDEAFVLRTATLLQRWADTNEAEACGVIVRSERGLQVRLITIRSQLNCAYDRALVGDTIHVHPVHDSHGVVKLTRATIAAMPQYEGQFTIKVNSRVFSQADYKRPGYLVTHGKLLYQSGKGSDRLVAQL